jgi:hypothetical protein
MAGGVLLLIHSLLALALFLNIHFNREAQAEMAWFLFMIADFPASVIVWKYLAHLPPFTALFEWGYTWGSGPNLRAFSVHLLFGGAQWFLVGWALGYIFLPNHGWVALHRKSASNPKFNRDAR